MKERQEIKLILAIMETSSWSYSNKSRDGKTGFISYGKNEIKVNALSFEKASLIDDLLREDTTIDKILECKKALF